MSPLICAANCRNALFAGPLTTAPEVEKVEPWHGQTNCDPEKPVIAQPSCVQVAVKTLIEVALVRVSRNEPRDVWVTAIPPVDASGEFAPTDTETVRPLTDPATDVSGCALEDGLVGLPPHPATVPIASSPAALLQHAQNSRRVGMD